MERQRLQDRLRELHAELQSAASPDAGERELLSRLAEDIRRLLDHEAGEVPSGATGLRQRLEEAALRLEASHPRTTVLIGRVIDTLVQMGI
ncbi:MAG TPA: DUF4404 family protein [Blastocatellia bacterium]|nr:DUF4404 family protein [Blastocatellia bacterium]